MTQAPQPLSSESDDDAVSRAALELARLLARAAAREACIDLDQDKELEDGPQQTPED